MTMNGVLLILFGILVLYEPELLAYIVAFVLIAIGASMVMAGWNLRRSSKRY